MFQAVFSYLLMIINFIQNKIISIQIGGISLLAWIIALVLISGVIILIFSLRPKLGLNIHKKEDKDNE